jgi:hypothetical protein
MRSIALRVSRVSSRALLVVKVLNEFHPPPRQGLVCRRIALGMQQLPQVAEEFVRLLHCHTPLGSPALATAAPPDAGNLHRSLPKPSLGSGTVVHGTGAARCVAPSAPHSETRPMSGRSVVWRPYADLYRLRSSHQTHCEHALYVMAPSSILTSARLNARLRGSAVNGRRTWLSLRLRAAKERSIPNRPRPVLLRG